MNEFGLRKQSPIYHLNVSPVGWEEPNFIKYLSSPFIPDFLTSLSIPSVVKN